nr:MFS transporter [Micromonospora purpureochromogenes]
MTVTDIRTRTELPAGWGLPVAVLAIGTFALGTDSFVLAGILPQISSDLAVSSGAAGQTVTVFALTYGIAAPFLATFTSHIPRRRLLIAAMSMFVIANIASALSPSLPVLLATRVFAGLGAALYTPTASAAAVALAGSQTRGRAMSVILGGLTLGTVAGVPLGTAIGQHASWRASLAFVAAVGAAAVAGIVALLPPLAIPPIVLLARRFSVLANRRIVAMVAYMVIVTAASFAVYTYAADVLGEVQGVHGSGLIVALLAWGLGGLVGSFGSGWTTDHWGPRRTLTTATVLLGTSLVALGLVHSAPLAVVVMAVYGAAGWAGSTPNNHRLAAEAPHLPAMVISFNSSAIYLGEALGAIVGGTLVSHHESATLLCVVAAGIAAAALLLHLTIASRK